jgi:hypothetical protein
MTSERHSFATGPGGRLKVVCDQGTVTVRGWRASTLDVSAEFRHPHAVDYRATGDGRDVRVEARMKRGLGMFLPWDSPRVDIEVSVPPGVRVDVRTTNGAVSVEDVTGEVVLSTVNGRVRASSTRGTLRLSSENGSLGVDSHEGPLTASTRNGAIDASRVNGELELRTVNGKVTVSFEPVPGSSNAVETVNGGVDAGIAGRTPVILDAKTVRGSTNIGALDADPDEEPARLRVRTVNGSVRVHESAASSRRPVYV